MRRAKSLRNGVHHANAVVWEPVYRTHLGRIRRRRIESAAAAADVQPANDAAAFDALRADAVGEDALLRADVAGRLLHHERLRGGRPRRRAVCGVDHHRARVDAAHRHRVLAVVRVPNVPAAQTPRRARRDENLELGDRRAKQRLVLRAVAVHFLDVRLRQRRDDDAAAEDGDGMKPVRRRGDDGPVRLRYGHPELPPDGERERAVRALDVDGERAAGGGFDHRPTVRRGDVDDAVGDPMRGAVVGGHRAETRDDDAAGRRRRRRGGGVGVVSSVVVFDDADARHAHARGAHERGLRDDRVAVETERLFVVRGLVAGEVVAVAEREPAPGRGADGVARGVGQPRFKPTVFRFRDERERLLRGERRLDRAVGGGGVEVALRRLRDPVPLRARRRGDRPADQRRALDVDPHARDRVVHLVERVAAALAVVTGEPAVVVLRASEVPAPKRERLGEEAKRGARPRQVRVVVRPRPHDRGHLLAPERSRDARRGVRVPAAVEAPDGQHGDVDVARVGAADGAGAPVRVARVRARVNRRPLAVHGLERVEPVDPARLPRGLVVFFFAVGCVIVVIFVGQHACTRVFVRRDASLVRHRHGRRRARVQQPRAPRQILPEQRPAHPVHVVGRALVRRAHRAHRPQARRLATLRLPAQRRDLQRDESAPRAAHEPHRAGAPTPGRDPLDGVARVSLLRRRVLVVEDAARVAAAARVDAHARDAVPGEVRPRRLVRVDRAVVDAVG
eukprot:30810-Pelagococcus_subviridis.AAC.1